MSKIFQPQLKYLLYFRTGCPASRPPPAPPCQTSNTRTFLLPSPALAPWRACSTTLQAVLQTSSPPCLCSICRLQTPIKSPPPPSTVSPPIRWDPNICSLIHFYKRVCISPFFLFLCFDAVILVNVSDFYDSWQLTVFYL